MPEHQQTQQSKESKPTFQKQAIPIIQSPISNPASIIQRARINPKSLTPSYILQLQSTIGNRAVGRLLSEIGLTPPKAKLLQSVQRQELVQHQEIPEEEEPLQGKFESKPEQPTCLSCSRIPIVQRQEIPEEEKPIQGKMIGTIRQEIPEEEEPLQKKGENDTGMSDNLKAGVENLSGIDMSDVKVHYNSSKPAEVGALAYTQGANIHVAPGQEKHLPHEAWHVVQQKQGRVRPTMQLKDVAINDDIQLEREADVMGKKVDEFSGIKKNRNLKEYDNDSLKQITQYKNAEVMQLEWVNAKRNWNVRRQQEENTCWAACIAYIAEGREEFVKKFTEYFPKDRTDFPRNPYYTENGMDLPNVVRLAHSAGLTYHSDCQCAIMTLFKTQPKPLMVGLAHHYIVVVAVYLNGSRTDYTQVAYWDPYDDSEHIATKEQFLAEKPHHAFSY